jgi:hypothetical protein
MKPEALTGIKAPPQGYFKGVVGRPGARVATMTLAGVS